jgi:hypothetical protein
LTYKVNGKTVSESFATCRAAQSREIDALRRYRQLERSFVEVNEKICRARPAEDPRTAKKTAKAIQTEIAREVTTLGRIFAELKQTDNIDLEVAEKGFRSALHQARAALTQLLQFCEQPPARVLSRAPAATKHTTASGAHGGSPLALGKVELARPGICVRTVIRANSLSIANPISKTATAHPGVRRMQTVVGQEFPSITAVHR